MKTINALADLVAPPTTFWGGLLRMVIIFGPFLFTIVALDNYFHSCAPAAFFSYALGALTTYGAMRPHLKD